MAGQSTVVIPDTEKVQPGKFPFLGLTSQSIELVSSKPKRDHISKNKVARTRARSNHNFTPGEVRQ